MQFWQPEIDPTQGPLYLAIADAIGQDIARGALKPGDRLPPQRRLAEGLRVDLTTVTRAYAEARRRGLLDATVGRGTYVRADPPPPTAGAERAVVDLSMNLPPQPPEPSLRALLQDGIAGLLRHADMATLMAYQSGAGTSQDREAAAAWLRPVMGETDPGRILVCAGAQSALTALLTLLARPGDTILTEPLTYPGLRAMAAHLGIRLLGVAVDAEGLLPDAVARACREAQPKALYCIPTIQNPTTATMPPQRRQALAEVALRHGIIIIEDDAYGLLPTVPSPAIATMAPDVTYYIGTLSKCLSPGLRTAFVAASGPAQARCLAAAVRATSLMAAPVMTSLVTAWIRDGSAEAFRGAIRQEMTARQQIAREMLPASSLNAHPEGLHAWLTLPPHWNRIDFSAHARMQGLALVPSDAFVVGPEAPNSVRICLGAAESRAALRTALQSVADAMIADVPIRFTDVV
ncbi:aminotransferase-like domain-containing protein [Limobrevibacterium gyesilva]|uniref:PLP-dependent aminotransferase family protein n=1 Tax=Limobrevibacterium gyesilva TaxID=2991712 RepID=A0AA42CI77_9PROT|nr:PLP-dependent aminotransferase family protein [Limobrevibacterium gyesilva]MCW3475667.1 PLP-dependent aminotransferase family protein [Limobrevibacterium gyesilva]